MFFVLYMPIVVMPLYKCQDGLFSVGHVESSNTSQQDNLPKKKVNYLQSSHLSQK